MSSGKNVEIVRRFYDAWERDVFPGPAELMDPDIEYVNPPEAVEPGTRRGVAEFAEAVEKLLHSWEFWRAEIEFIPMRAPLQGSFHGHAGIRKFFADNEENFDVFHLTGEEMHDLGDRIVGIGKLRVKGKGSGVDVTVSTGVVMTLEDGKVVRFEDFGDRAKALEAAGSA